MLVNEQVNLVGDFYKVVSLYRYPTKFIFANARQRTQELCGILVQGNRIAKVSHEVHLS